MENIKNNMTKMVNTCDYCSKDLKDMNVENKTRHINKHIKNGHEKTSKIKPITGFFHKQAAVMVVLNGAI